MLFLSGYGLNNEEPSAAAIQTFCGAPSPDLATCPTAMATGSFGVSCQSAGVSLPDARAQAGEEAAAGPLCFC